MVGDVCHLSVSESLVFQLDDSPPQPVINNNRDPRHVPARPKCCDDFDCCTLWAVVAGAICSLASLGAVVSAILLGATPLGCHTEDKGDTVYLYCPAQPLLGSLFGEDQAKYRHLEVKSIGTNHDGDAYDGLVSLETIETVSKDYTMKTSNSLLYVMDGECMVYETMGYPMNSQATEYTCPIAADTISAHTSPQSCSGRVSRGWTARGYSRAPR